MRIVLSIVPTLALVALLAVACWHDVRARRIPNALTLAGAGVGLLLRVPLGGAALLDGAAGLGVAVLLALPPFALGFLGGGDVKLLGAVGAFLGLGHLPGALAFVALAGGVLALLEAARQHALKRALANTYGFAKDWVLFARAGVAARWQAPGTMSVPYGIAIAIGTLAWWFLGGGSL
jgi:prepilin peptidase CpaA